MLDDSENNCHLDILQFLPKLTQGVVPIKTVDARTRHSPTINDAPQSTRPLHPFPLFSVEPLINSTDKTDRVKGRFHS